MKKRISMLLVVLILLEQVFAAGTANPVRASARIKDTIDIEKPVNRFDITPFPSRFQITPTPTPITGDPTHGDVIQGDPTHVDPTPTLTPTPTPTPTSTPVPDEKPGTLIKDGDTANAKKEKIVAALLKSESQIHLAAKKMLSIPKDNTEFTENTEIYIDWNKATTSFWWFKCTREEAFKENEKVYYQISLYPFSNDDATRHNPGGLLEEGVIARNNANTFTLNFDKFAPRRSEVVKKFATPALMDAIRQDLPSGKTKVAGRLLDASSIKSKLQLRSNTMKNESKTRFRNALNSYVKSTGKGFAERTAASKVQASFNGDSVRTIMESFAAPKTMYKFYVRVFSEDKDGKLTGLPSNGLTVYYGEPSFKGEVKQVAYKMDYSINSVVTPNKNGEAFVNWNDKAALNKLLFSCTGLTIGDNYAYMYYQITTKMPDNNLEKILNPDGLVYSLRLSTGSWTKIDFTKFAPPVTNSDTRLTYYIRAVAVYHDPDNPGNATASVTTPRTIIYGAPAKQGSSGVQTPMNDWSEIIDIGTPKIQFAQYTPPDRGLSAGDCIIVTKVPGSGPFKGLHVGQKTSFSSLKQVLVEREKDVPWYKQLGNFFVEYFNSICSAINFVSNAWAKIQSYAVKGLGAIGIPESIGGYLVNAALVAAGIPPTFPNVNDLKNMGKGQLAAVLVEQAGGYIPQDLADMAVDELFDQAEKAAEESTISTIESGTGLESLNGCVRPDPDFFCKNATITLTLTNPYNRVIPAGEFDLNTHSAGRYANRLNYVYEDSYKLFNTERVRYPALQPGQKMNITVSLEESVAHTEANGMREYLDNSPYPLKSYFKDTEITAEVTGLKPDMPDSEELYSSLGLNYDERAYMSFNILINTPLPYNFGNVKMTSAKTEFQNSLVYVSAAGNDSNGGTADRPFRTLQRALSAVGSGGTVMVGAGTYEANSLNVNKSDIAIIGSGEGTIVKTPAKADYAFIISAPGVTIKEMTVNGCMKSTADKTLLEKLKLTFSTGRIGVHLSENHYSQVRSCDVAKTGNTYSFAVIHVDGGYENNVDGCTIHGAPSGAVLTTNNSSLNYTKRTNKIRNSTIYDCLKGLRLTNNSTFDCDSFEAPQSGMSRMYNNLFQPYTIMAEGCNIYNCKTGVVLSGSNTLMQNCYIHDMEENGVQFFESDACGIKFCTLYNTNIPIYFKGGNADKANCTGTSYDFYENTVAAPNIASNCAFVEDENTDDGTMVVVDKDGMDDKYNGKIVPYTASNYFYSTNGPVIFLDKRPGNQKGMRFYMGDIKKWNSYTVIDRDANNYEENPRIDAYGRSANKNLLNAGVQ